MFNHEKALREIEFLSEQEAKIYTWNSMELVVPPTVYPPREDTNLLHDIVADIAPFGAKKLLEIGCGSGAISIAAAKLGWSVDACDINPYAVAATRNNAMRHNVVLQVSESGLGPQDEQMPEVGWNHDLYDVVLWNMPYIPHSEVNENLLGPLEEASLVDTHPTGLLEVFARLMSNGKLCTWNGIALLVCREVVHWKRSVDVLRQQGLADVVHRRYVSSERPLDRPVKQSHSMCKVFHLTSNEQIPQAIQLDACQQEKLPQAGRVGFRLLRCEGCTACSKEQHHRDRDSNRLLASVHLVAPARSPTLVGQHCDALRCFLWQPQRMD